MARIVSVALVIGAVLAGAPAAGAVGWVTSGPLSPPDRTATQQQVALTPGGERIIGWTQLNATGNAPENFSVRIAPPGQDFGPIQTFPNAGFGGRLAVGADGTVAVGWTENTNALHISSLAPGAATFVDHTFLIPTPTNDFVFLDDLVVTATGDVYASVGSTSVLGAFWIARLPAGQANIALVPGPGAAGQPNDAGSINGQARRTVSPASLASDGNHVSILWAAFNEPGNNQNQSTTLLVGTLGPDGTFSSRTLDSVTGDTPDFAPSLDAVIAGGGGHTFVAWTHPATRDLAYQDLGNPGVTQSLPGAGFGPGSRVGVDGSGTLVTAWDGFVDGGVGTVVTSLIAPLGTAPPPLARLTSTGVQRQLDDLAVAPDGTALALSDRESFEFDPREVQGSFRAPGATSFGPPEAISGLQENNSFLSSPAAAAVASGGRAVALWSAPDPTGRPNMRLFLSERDVAPPAFSSITVPDATRVGDRVDLAAAASDTQSDTTVTWDFGDGSQATGDAVSHVFATPGAVTVTVTATDAAGNTTTQTRVIAVGPAATAPPPPQDTTPPVVTGLSLSRTRFRVGAAPTAQVATRRHKAKAAPAGTALRLTLDERATLAVEIDARTHGRSAVRGTLVRGGEGPGAAAIAFSGRIGRTALAPGTYRATVTAIDGAGNRSRPASVSFTIVR